MVIVMFALRPDAAKSNPLLRMESHHVDTLDEHVRSSERFSILYRTAVTRQMRAQFGIQILLFLVKHAEMPSWHVRAVQGLAQVQMKKILLS